MNCDPIAPVSIKSEPIESNYFNQATDQSANMASEQKSEDKNVDQLKLLLNMNCLEINQLIISLNELSAILQCNKAIPEDAKPRIRKRIDDTMRLLVNLSPFEPIKSSDDSGVFEEIILDETSV